MPDHPTLDPASPLQFVINAAAGSSDANAKREVIESVLQSEGRLGDLHFCNPAQLPIVARTLAAKALSIHTAIVAVGGDGTLNTVAQAAHAAGCAIGVVPLGTFNYFARARLRHPYARFITAFGNDLEPVHRSPDLMVLGVNTTRASRHKDGEISVHQVERVARVLEQAAPAQLRVVVVHQPVAVTRQRDVPNRLQGHAAALRRWAVAGADLVMGGHIHLPYVMRLPDLARPMWAVQAGTAISSRVREGLPNSVNLLRWGDDAFPGCCQIEQWDFSAGDGVFVLAGVNEVQPVRA